jgi:hypothetical protein
MAEDESYNPFLGDDIVRLCAQGRGKGGETRSERERSRPERESENEAQ